MKPTPPRATRRAHARAMQARTIAAGVAIPHDTPDLLLAIKRELWTRGLTIRATAQRIGLAVGEDGHAGLLSSVLNGRERLTPGLLERVIEVVHITPAVARRLHAMGAARAGWKVGEATPQATPGRYVSDPETGSRNGNISHRQRLTG